MANVLVAGLCFNDQVHESQRTKLRPVRAAVAGRLSAAVVLSVEDRDSLFAIAPDGLLCQSRSAQVWTGARATMGVVEGSHYFEMKVMDEGLSRIGWATIAAARELGKFLCASCICVVVSRDRKSGANTVA